MEKDKTSTNDDVTSKAARRRFLQSLGIVAVTSVASTFNILHAPANANEKKSNGVSSNRRYGMLIDTAKCARDCDACVRGCDEEHGLGADKHGGVRDEIRARWIQKVDLEDKLTGRRVSLPMLCQHCDSAPCVDVCPTGASFKRADGIVLVNKHTCIGCRYCMMACPYNARSFIHEKITEQKSWAPRGKGTVESCTLCVHRIDADVEQGPACAEACTQAGHSAITFGDLNDENSEISKRLTNEPSVQVRSDLELNTGVRYTAL